MGFRFDAASKESLPTKQKVLPKVYVDPQNILHYVIPPHGQVAHCSKISVQRCCHGVKSPEWPGAYSVAFGRGDGNLLVRFPNSPFSRSDMLTSTLTCFVMAYSGD